MILEFLVNLIGLRRGPSRFAYIKLSDSEQYVPYSSDYLRLIARKGFLPAKKFGKDWYTTRADVERYSAEHNGGPLPVSGEPPAVHEPLTLTSKWTLPLIPTLLFSLGLAALITYSVPRVIPQSFHNDVPNLSSAVAESVSNFFGNSLGSSSYIALFPFRSAANLIGSTTILERAARNELSPQHILQEQSGYSIGARHSFKQTQEQPNVPQPLVIERAPFTLTDSTLGPLVREMQTQTQQGITSNLALLSSLESKLFSFEGSAQNLTANLNSQQSELRQLSLRLDALASASSSQDTSRQIVQVVNNTFPIPDYLITRHIYSETGLTLTGQELLTLSTRGAMYLNAQNIIIGAGGMKNNVGPRVTFLSDIVNFEDNDKNAIPIQTGGVTRLDENGNLTNIGDITATGTASFAGALSV